MIGLNNNLTHTNNINSAEKQEQKFINRINNNIKQAESAINTFNGLKSDNAMDRAISIAKIIAAISA